MMSSTFIVTGGAGFIGVHVTEQLIARGARVIVVDDLSRGSAQHVPPNAEFAGSRDCSTLTAGDIPQGSTLVHLAAHPRCNSSLFAPVADAVMTYVPGLKTLVAALNARVDRFVLVSSMSVYGDAPSPYVETSTPLPRDPHAVNKRALELVVEQECRAHGVSYVIVRPQHVFGRGQRSDLTYRNVVARWSRLLLAGQPLPVFGSLDLERAFSPVTLIARSIVAAATRDDARNEVMNLGTRNVRSLRTLATWIASTIGASTPVFEQRPSPPTLLSSVIGRVDKAERLLDVREGPDEADRCLRELVEQIRVMPRINAESGFSAEVLEREHDAIYRASP